VKAGWYICDKKKIYIQRAWGSEREAVKEMAELLWAYPEGHMWRERLNVQYRQDSKDTPKRGGRRKVLKEVTDKVIPIATMKDGPKCPHCNMPTERTVIPCPDGAKEVSPGVWKASAIVLYGWVCRHCNPPRYYTEE